jgi:hypothetical protein
MAVIDNIFFTGSLYLNDCTIVGSCALCLGASLRPLVVTNIYDDPVLTLTPTLYQYRQSSLEHILMNKKYLFQISAKRNCQ